MAKAAAAGMKTTMHIQKYESIFRALQFWNISSFIKTINANKNKGGVLQFIRGLRLSAQLIYAIRIALSDKPYLEVSWGHILDKNGNFLSRECDIIIHKAGCVEKWNGGVGCVMDFRFIEQKNAIAVISCKSNVTSSVITSEKTYCKEMKSFTNKIWMFGECCSPNSLLTLKQTAINTGFKNFWCAYTWNKRTDKIEAKHDEWLEFIKEIQKLK